jgi:hypothetical protein
LAPCAAISSSLTPSHACAAILRCPTPSVAAAALKSMMGQVPTQSRWPSWMLGWSTPTSLGCSSRCHPSEVWGVGVDRCQAVGSGSASQACMYCTGLIFAKVPKLPASCRVSAADDDNPHGCLLFAVQNAQPLCPCAGRVATRLTSAPPTPALISSGRAQVLLCQAMHAPPILTHSQPHAGDLVG